MSTRSIEHAKVLVTGGSGLVGSHLVETLLARGADVTCLVRPKRDPRWLRDLPVHRLEGEIEQPASYQAELAQAEVVFHVAGLTKSLDESAYDRVNYRTTVALLHACLASAGHLRRLVLVSSLAAVGPSPVGGRIDEDAPCRPVTPYGQSKLRAEQAARDYSLRLPITIVRPPVVYGPRDPDNLAIYRLARGGLVPVAASTTQLSLIHVRDLAAGVVRAAEVEAAVGRTYFLAHPEPVTYRAIALMAATALGRSVRVLEVPPFLARVLGAGMEHLGRLQGRPTVFDRHKATEMLAGNWVCMVDRAAAELGFRATTPHPAGFAETAAWYRSAGWL